MDSSTSSKSVLESELYFLIARFLSAGPCKRTSKVLLEELEEFKLLPQRTDWEGHEHFRTYENLVYLNRHIRCDHLLRIVERVGTLLDKEVKPSIPGVRSLLGAGSLSLLRTAEDTKHSRWNTVQHTQTQNGALCLPPANLSPPSVPQVLHAYQLSGLVRRQSIVPSSVYSKISIYGRKLGHLSAVYCVLFDRTGNYIFTGADDALVKVWSKHDMRLLATLRGHSAEITDMAVSYENTYLASASCDKVLRVWCLRTKAPAAVLLAHSSMITSVQFCPKINGDNRYLVSTGNDGCVCFWHFNCSTKVFSPKPIKFIEKSRAGAQMLCSSFSPGGAFLATGNSDHVVRVYFLHAAGPEKICELEAHADKVDSICYSNHHNRFVSGSNDGTARIWRFEKHDWRATVLNMASKLDSCHTRMDPNKEQVRVTMVSWSMDDNMVITAASDLTMKIWNSFTGSLLRILEGHEDEVFVLEACPTDPRILLSAGHDGKMFIWDIYTGTKLKKFFNLIEGQGHGAVFDCKFSSDGQVLAATDSHGHLILMGFGSNERCKKIPQQLFFHTDYRPLMRDSNNYVLDEQSQQPPHLMPPPFLVDLNGNPYPSNMQRLVPGREHNKESSLIPHIVVNADGESEVVGDREGNNDDANEDSSSDEHEISDGDEPRPAPVGRQGDASRPSIDLMIEELQRQQDERLGVEAAGTSSSVSSQSGPSMAGQVMSPPPPPLTSPSAPRSSLQNRIGMRRSGEIEGVRQSLGNMAVRVSKKERDAWRRRITVKPLDSASLRLSEERRLAFSEEEVKKFLAERKKKLLSPSEVTAPQAATKNRRQKQPKKTSGIMDNVAENEELARNRLTTRALYDTEEEEDEGGGSDLWGGDSESSEDYSDWVGDQGSSNLEPPKRRSQRKRKRRHFSSSDEEDVLEKELDVEDMEDTDIDDTSTDENSSDDEEDEESEGQQPTSSKRESRRVTVQKQSAKRKENKLEKKKTPRPSLVQQNKDQPITELPEHMRPPEWITTVIPRKAPFVPQMGDEIIYFRQGHEQYLLAVERKKVYGVDLEKNQPWHKIPNLKAHELVKIVGIKWLMKPTRLCCLKLAFLDTETGKLTGKSFTIKYHDMPDVIDFLVLKQHYDISVQRGWKPGMRFRSMIDDQWWMGIIKSQEPLNDSFPDSLFQCFNVHWDNGEYEKLSPWDMEPVDPKRKPSVVGGGVDVTQDEYKSLLYVPKKTEWTSVGREVESERLIRGLETLMQHSLAEPFSFPVDLQQFPSYAFFVSYPIDLSTIKTRLENGFYRRITALQWDVRCIHSNARIFNKSGSTIVKNAYAVSETLLRFIKDHGCQDPMPILAEVAHGGFRTATSDEDSQAGPHGQSTQTKKTGTERKRRKSRPAPDPNAWLEQSESILAMLFECEDSEPFQIPVDPEQYPDYEDIVSNPMDLTTVHTKLATGHYGNPVDMCQDIRLIFQNSKLYNTNKRSRIYSMTLRLSALFEDQISQVINQWKSALKASGRIQRNSRLKQRPAKSSSEQSSYWDEVFKNTLPVDQPSTSSQMSSSFVGQAQSSRLSGRHSPVHRGTSKTFLNGGQSSRFGRKKGVIKDEDNDSDATIVDNEDIKKEDYDDDNDDGGDTEVCDESHSFNGVPATDSSDDDDDDDKSDDNDNDYKPSSKYRVNGHKAQTAVGAKGKCSQKGKGKSSRPLPMRTARGRWKKSSIFYTSDGNDEDIDNTDDDAPMPPFSSLNRTSTRLQDKLKEDEEEELSPPQESKSKKLSVAKAIVKRPKRVNRPNHRYSPDLEKAPPHRKERGTRSKKCIKSDEEETVEVVNTNGNSVSALKRSARSARCKKKYYGEGDSDDIDSEEADDKDAEVEEHDNKHESEESEEDSSDEINDDSEDEIINKSLRMKGGTSAGSKVFSSRFNNRRRLPKSEEEEDSDSDVPVPKKRLRTHSITPPKRSSKGSSRCIAPQKKTKAQRGRRSGSNSKIRTRNRGKQNVTYLEDDSDVGEDVDDEDDEEEEDDTEEDSSSGSDEISSRNSVSSRGRLRKLTPRARASLKVR